LPRLALVSLFCAAKSFLRRWLLPCHSRILAVTSAESGILSSCLCLHRRHRWPRDLNCGSSAAGFLESRVRNRPRHGRIEAESLWKCRKISTRLHGANFLGVFHSSDYLLVFCFVTAYIFIVFLWFCQSIIRLASVTLNTSVAVETRQPAVRPRNQGSASWK
jgi:hypothetical protein